MASREGVKAGKWVHHRCGYQLWVEVLHRFSGQYEGMAASGASVVVTYRDNGVVVSMCPRCYGALRLWWPANSGESGGSEDGRDDVGDAAGGSEQGV